MAVDPRIPISPIHGCIIQVGDATHPATVQLLNNSGTKNVVIYHLYHGSTGGAPSARNRARRVVTPLTLAGTITTALVQRMDETDLTAIAATLKGCNQCATTTTEALSFWFDISPTPGQGHYDIIRPGDYPLIVKPGSSFDLQFGTNSAANGILLYAIWDELTP